MWASWWELRSGAHTVRCGNIDHVAKKGVTVVQLLGRRGWWRRCRCCNDRRSNGQLRSTEKQRWKRDWREHPAF